MVHHTTDNNLLVRVYPAGIHYSISDDNKQVILQQTVNMSSQKLNDIQFLEHFFNQPELRVLSENVSIIIENNDYQLIPNELFRADDFHLFFEPEFGKTDNSKLIYNLLPRWAAHLVFRVEESLSRFFENKYPEAEVEHHIAGLLRKKVDRNSDAIYVNVRKETVDLLVVKEKALLLTNSFSVKTAEDICFFVLNAYELLELDTRNFALHLLSETPLDATLKELLGQYITIIHE